MNTNRSNVYFAIVSCLTLLKPGSIVLITCAGIEYVKCPVMLFHGERDSTIPVGTAMNLVQR